MILLKYASCTVVVPTTKEALRAHLPELETPRVLTREQRDAFWSKVVALSMGKAVIATTMALEAHLLPDRDGPGWRFFVDDLHPWLVGVQKNRTWPPKIQQRDGYVR